MNRSIKQIKSEINRAKAQIEAFHKDHFTEEDRSVLIPKYEETLKQLENELITAQAKDKPVIAEVIDYKTDSKRPHKI